MNQKNSSSLPGAMEIGIRMHNLSDNRGKPRLIQQWQYLWRQDFVELRHGAKVTEAGWIDDVNAAGSIVWIQLVSGKGRILIHRNDGIDLWRIES
ncbi:hypothetical protein [Pseudarthrobacter raffinosi]|uniref:hypothetical protein n=1 Tax=Pseudarthrobacter raffinosi TaxID=2953651 RepID=UPI00208F2E42|nr:hypothetical protein [Pseudarthrobacter sp. MDT3-9]